MINGGRLRQTLIVNKSKHDMTSPFYKIAAYILIIISLSSMIIDGLNQANSLVNFFSFIGVAPLVWFISKTMLMIYQLIEDYSNKKK